jgi:hypothetical protein
MLKRYCRIWWGRLKIYDNGKFADLFFSFIYGNTRYSDIDCSHLKEGVFKASARLEDGSIFTTIITRKKNLQYEEVPENVTKAVFKVEWVSDCAYNLINPKVIKGKFPALKPDLKLYVKIISIEADGYTVEITSNSYTGIKTFKLYNYK